MPAASATPDAPAVLHLSLVLGGALRDADGTRLGRVDDLIVRLGGAAIRRSPASSRRSPGAQVFVPAERVAAIGHGRGHADQGEARPAPVRAPRRRGAAAPRRARPPADQRRRAPGWCAPTRSSSRGSTAGGGWSASTPAPAAGSARLLPKPLAGRIGTGDFVDWASLEPFTGARPDGADARPPPEAGATAPGADRRPGRGRLARRGRGDHAGGRRATRSSRPTSSRSSTRATSSSSSRSAPTTRSRSCSARMAPDDAADLVAELRRGAPRGGDRAASPPVHAAQGPGAARLRPGRGGRADEPRLRQRLPPGDRRRGARAGAPLAPPRRDALATSG